MMFDFTETARYFLDRINRIYKIMEVLLNWPELRARLARSRFRLSESR